MIKESSQARKCGFCKRSPARFIKPMQLESQESALSKQVRKDTSRSNNPLSIGEDISVEFTVNRGLQKHSVLRLQASSMSSLRRRRIFTPPRYSDHHHHHQHYHRHQIINFTSGRKRLQNRVNVMPRQKYLNLRMALKQKQLHLQTTIKE